jgi:DNA-binding transcriptional ArsR family regulator
MQNRDVFQAIADPSRRAIIGLLAMGSLNVNAIAENFEMSRPAVSKHIKILKDCDLVKSRKEGRERIYQLKPQKLQELDTWLAQYKTFWSSSLDRLESILEPTTENK